MTHTETPWEAHQGLDDNMPSVWMVTAKTDEWTPCDITPQGWFVADVHEVRDESSANANAARIVACVNACDGIDNAALDAGVIAELVEAVQAFMPSNINMDCDMSNDAIIPLDVKLIELRAIQAALVKLGQTP